MVQFCDVFPFSGKTNIWVWSTGVVGLKDTFWTFQYKQNRPWWTWTKGVLICLKLSVSKQVGLGGLLTFYTGHQMWDPLGNSCMHWQFIKSVLFDSLNRQNEWITYMYHQLFTSTCMLLLRTKSEQNVPFNTQDLGHMLYKEMNSLHTTFCSELPWCLKKQIALRY